MMKLFSVFALLLTLSGCGFEPVYATRSSAASSEAEAPWIAVAPVHGRSGQHFTIALENRLNPYGQSGLPWRLEVSLNEGEQPALIESDGSIVRYTIFLESSWRLVRLADGTAVDHGVIRRNSAYAVTNANYADYVTREHAFDQLAETLAGELALRLAAVRKEKAQP